MLKTKLIIFGLLLAFGLSAQAQDTISAYFGFGRAHLTSAEEVRIASLMAMEVIGSIDSIVLIGFTDSVGNINANERLSSKRCRSVEKYLRRQMGLSTEPFIIPQGELTEGGDSLNRRVEIIRINKARFFEEAAFKDKGEDKENDKELERLGMPLKDMCREVEFKLLRNCNISFSIRKGKTEVILQTELLDMKEQELYYVEVGSDGREQLKRLRWKLRTTGRLWWKKKRYVTRLPKESYDRSRIISLQKPPCKKCQWVNPEGETRPMAIAMRHEVDTFLMRNLQTKVVFLNPFKLNVRVPKEYVNPLEDYFIARSSKGSKVEWKEKRGRKKRDYYFTKLPRMRLFRSPVNITRLQPYCPERLVRPRYQGVGDNGESPVFPCDSIQEIDTVRTYLSMEIGAQNFKDYERTYAAIRLGRNFGAHQLSLSLGVSNQLELRSTMRYRKYIGVIPVNTMFPAVWSDPCTRPAPQRYFFTAPFVSTELISLGLADEFFQTVGGGLELQVLRKIAPRSVFSVMQGVLFDYQASNLALPQYYTEAALILDFSNILYRKSERRRARIELLKEAVE